jgi:hypothetical protein
MGGSAASRNSIKVEKIKSRAYAANHSFSQRMVYVNFDLIVLGDGARLWAAKQ